MRNELPDISLNILYHYGITNGIFKVSIFDCSLLIEILLKFVYKPSILQIANLTSSSCIFYIMLYSIALGGGMGIHFELVTYLTYV